MEKENKDKEVQLGRIGEIDLPKIDVTEYIGKKTKIDIVTVHESTAYEGYYAKVQTKVVAEVGSKDKKIELKGSRIFGLQSDKDGKIGYGKETKLGIFLAKMKCKELKDLIGKEVILQVQTSKEGTDFLSFN